MAAVATATVSKNVVLHVFSPSASILVLRLRKTRAAFQGQARLPLHDTNGTLQHRGILLDIVDIAKASDVVGLRTVILFRVRFTTWLRGKGRHSARVAIEVPIA